MSTQIQHFIDGRRSQPGQHPHRGRLQSQHRRGAGQGAARLGGRRRHRRRLGGGGAEGVGGVEPAEPRPGADEVHRTGQRQRRRIAELLSIEHGKTVPDSLGDIQRGIEVIEFATGIPHLMKGEFTEGAGPGIDVYSIRQPLGVVCGITPFNFPAMIPLWKAGPALACGNAFILKPSERDPSVPLRLAELFLEAGLPPGVFQVVKGDKEAVDALLDHPDIKAYGFVGSSDIAQYIYSRAAAGGKRAQCFGGAKNHMIVMPDSDLDQAIDALVGAGYGSAGERCMAISVAVAVGEETANRLRNRLAERVEHLRVGHSLDPKADYGPLVTEAALDRVRGYIDAGVAAGAELVVDGRDKGQRRTDIRRREPRGRLLHRPHPVRPRHHRHVDLHRRDLRAGGVHRAGQELRGGAAAAQRARVRQRGGDLHPRRRHRPRLRLPGPGRHGRRQRADPGSGGLPHLRRLEALRFRRPQPARPGGDPVLHQGQDQSPSAGRRASRMAPSSSSRR